MFDLEKSIAEWREQMLAAGIKTPVPLEELESHLREEVERKVKSGLSAQQAFAVAARQMGKADLLNNEFKKETIEERDWKLNQIIVAGCMGLVTSVIAVALSKNGGITAAQRISGLTALAVFNLLMVGGRLSYRLFPVISNHRTRNAVFVSGGALVAIWLTIFFNVVLLRFNYSVSQLVLAALWGMTMPAGMLGGLIAGIETAARKNSASGR